jgi:D-alanyl-D-alanine carboxypeptidase
VHGYLLNAEGDLIDQTDDLAWFGNGANGGVVSTADELLTLMQAITSGELLGDELTAQMKEVHLASYGLGLAEYSLTCGTFYGHAGSVLGTQSIALVSEDSATGVVVAVNITESVDPRLAAVADTLVCLPH